MHEAGVDLELANRQLAQIAERGIAGAEVVQRQGQADAAQLLHHGLDRGCLAVDEHRFGKLELDRAGRQADLLEQRHGGLDEAVAGKLLSRDVDRDRRHRQPLRPPQPGLPAGRAQDPGAQPVDQARALGDRHELGRRHPALALVPPAQQRLRASNLAARKLDLRLKEQLQQIAVERLAQRCLEILPALDRRVHARLEEAEEIAAAILGLVQRKIGVAHQIRQLRAVARRQGDADAGGDAGPLAIEVERGPDAVQDPLGDLNHGRRLGQLGQHDREFVAAQAAQAVARPQNLPQALGDLDQQEIAGVMAEAVIDLLEAVQVEQQQGSRGLAQAAAAQHLLEMLTEQGAIAEASQRIVIGQLLQLGRDLTALILELAVAGQAVLEGDDRPGDLADLVAPALLDHGVAHVAGRQPINRCRHVADRLGNGPGRQQGDRQNQDDQEHDRTRKSDAQIVEAGVDLGAAGHKAPLGIVLEPFRRRDRFKERGFGATGRGRAQERAAADQHRSRPHDLEIMLERLAEPGEVAGPSPGHPVEVDRDIGHALLDRVPDAGQLRPLDAQLMPDRELVELGLELGQMGGQLERGGIALGELVKGQGGLVLLPIEGQPGGDRQREQRQQADAWRDHDLERDRPIGEPSRHGAPPAARQAGQPEDHRRHTAIRSPGTHRRRAGAGHLPA